MNHDNTELAVRKTQLMRGKGITYDTGFFHAGVSTREIFDPEIMKREMRIIHDDLHCNVVRITGGNADRLELAAIHAVSAGLEVWFRAPAGRMPDVLEVGIRGRRHPRVEAYWDGCAYAL